MHKLSKVTVAYRPARNKIRCCGTCEFYDDNECEIVAGHIDPDDTCNEWEEKELEAYHL